ncbi:MAG TPA: hypothetical protein VGC76_06900 [Pyrinomonadaceae bacterium]|jgi:hypothetical protein
MTDETQEQNKNSTKESIEGVGQAIIGEIEIIGGILTADPVTQAEGEFNVDAGTLRRETSETLEDTDESEESKQ